MSYAFELGQKLVKQALVKEVGEKVVQGLNRVAPKKRMGLNLLNSGGLGKRIAEMEAKYGGPGASAHRTKMIDAVRSRARNTRMQRIGTGALVGGGALAAGGLANDQMKKREEE